MLNAIKLIHILGKNDSDFIPDESAFIIQTCQRSIILQTIPVSLNNVVMANPFEYFEGKEAYLFLLETICGLKSKLLGESEVVSQFKEAFSKYIAGNTRSNVIIKVLEKLFKDAKDIRREYLLEIGQQSYAGISRKILQTYTSTDNKVLILGSGKLAFDVIKQLGKKFEIYLSARNLEKSIELIAKFPELNITFVDWGAKSGFSHFQNIINTIGSDTIIFDHNFFTTRKNKNLFIDLGSPSIIKTEYNCEDGVFRLQDVFDHAKDLNNQKQLKITNAQNAILNVVEKRSHSLGHNYPYSWEELLFSY